MRIEKLWLTERNCKLDHSWESCEREIGEAERGNMGITVTFCIWERGTASPKG